MASKVDFIAQTIAFLAIGYFFVTLHGDDFIFLTLIIQFLLGLAQVISGIVCLVVLRRFTQSFKKMVIGYWIAVVAYFIVLFFLAMPGEGMALDVWLRIVPWAIAVFWYVTTILRAFDHPIAQLSAGPGGR